MKEARKAKFRHISANHQFDATIILENVHDPHNIGAVLRSCEAVGISEIYIVYTEQTLRNAAIDFFGNKTAAGTKKWITIHYFEDLAQCFDEVRKKYSAIYTTHLTETSTDLYDMDLVSPIALVFGNEHSGVTEEAVSLADGNFIIPQMGMVESLNISVACAVSLYEMLRQRRDAGKYGRETVESQKRYEEMVARHEERGSHPNLIKY